MMRISLPVIVHIVRNFQGATHIITSYLMNFYCLCTTDSLATTMLSLHIKISEQPKTFVLYFHTVDSQRNELNIHSSSFMIWIMNRCTISEHLTVCYHLKVTSYKLVTLWALQILKEYHFFFQHVDLYRSEATYNRHIALCWFTWSADKLVTVSKHEFTYTYLCNNFLPLQTVSITLCLKSSSYPSRYFYLLSCS